MGYGGKEHQAGDFGKSSYCELAYSVKTYLGIRPFGCSTALPVDGLGLLSGHPLPPPYYFRSILVAGFVTLMSLPVARQTYRRVNGHSSFLQSSGGILKKCVTSQAVYPLSEQHGLKARERRYTAHEEGKHWE